MEAPTVTPMRIPSNDHGDSRRPPRRGRAKGLATVALIVIVGGALAGGVAAAVASSPAQAAVPDRWAFAYMHNATPPPGLLMDPSRQFKSDGVINSTVTAGPIGRYRVVFPNIASANGVAHVTAVAGDARWCQVFNLFTSGANQVVEVQCYKHSGVNTPDWSRFTVMYSTSSGGPVGGGTYAYVHGKITGGTGASYNPVGLVNTMSHGGIGSGTYKVWLPGTGTGLFDGNIQVTAQHPNSPRRCKVDSWNPIAGGQDIVVRCYNEASAPADSYFNLTYHRERSVYGAFNPPKNFAYLWTPAFPGGPSNYNSVGSVNTLTPSGPGQSYIEFHKVGYKETHIQVTAFKGGANYCNLQEVWHLSGAVVVVRNVICFNAVGAQANTDFFITYTSRV